MTSTQTFGNAADTPATVLRHLASRAYQVLKDEQPRTRCEVLDLLDEIARLRVGFDSSPNPGELLVWFDRLEGQVAELLDEDDEEPAHCMTDPCRHQGVGVA